MFENMGKITGLTMKKIKTSLLSAYCFCLADFITFPSGRSLAKN